MYRHCRAISRHRQRTLPLSSWRCRVVLPSVDEDEQQLREERRTRRRAHMLAWVYRQMRLRLTQRERHCVVLYYLREMSYGEIALSTHTDRSAACRAVTRGIRKLRQAAQDDPAWQD